ncbi:hypothetical protein [Pseudomonas sp. GL-RE-26]|uniref:hypothetical protein n=1 Tax=Pseudomonas sp. GL-RE-26 TaxID=2832390 RepID=UPI001CBCBDE6|nr:hypothetical protein [Pseudomonas sp. GL-RE-26]
MTGKISVEDGLLVLTKTVLACRIGKTGYPPFMAIRKDRDQKPWEYIDGDTCHTRITHWFPIPDMPK